MSNEEAISKLRSFIDFYNKKPKEENRKFKMLQVDNIDIKAIETLLTAYEKEKKKNKNKDKILRNIREEFLKYDWKDANPIQTYNQIKSLYESIYCKPYED